VRTFLSAIMAYTTKTIVVRTFLSAMCAVVVFVVAWVVAVISAAFITVAKFIAEIVFTAIIAI